MSVQKLAKYYDAPERGYQGDLAELGDYRANFQIASEDMGVGLAIKKGDDLDPGAIGSFAYKVDLPSATSQTIIGVTLRVPGLEGVPSNTQDSVPTYKQGDPVNFLEEGYIWIKALAAVPAARQPAYVVHTVGTYTQLGAIVPVDAAGETDLLSNVYFVNKAALGEIVKVWVGFK